MRLLESNAKTSGNILSNVRAQDATSHVICHILLLFFSDQISESIISVSRKIPYCGFATRLNNNSYSHFFSGFNHVADHNNRSGNDRKEFEFYDEIRDILGFKDGNTDISFTCVESASGNQMCHYFLTSGDAPLIKLLNAILEIL